MSELDTVRSANAFEELRQSILTERYCWKSEDGHVVETPQQMFERVARTVAAVSARYGATDREVHGTEKLLFDLMTSNRFLPNSPTLMNAGRKNGMLSACFVLPIEDSLDGIFQTMHEAALVQKAGGGTGFAFDRLRPTGDIVASTGGTTSGPISFLHAYSGASRSVQQGAMRRGANMGMMAIHHPDILNFITAKQKPGELENFNLSVKVTNHFMARLRDCPSEPHVVVNPRTKLRYVIPRRVHPLSYSLRNLLPEGASTEPCYSVSELWETIVHAAWASGEPGVCFIDRINEANPTPHVGRFEATNPCGEQPLLPYESCNLGSVNISKFVKIEAREIDWQGLEAAIHQAVLFLDNVNDANHYPLESIREATLANRKIGLGLMGFADMLMLLRIRYDSDEAVQLAAKVAEFLTERAHHCSQQLAETRGSFPNWKGSVWDTKHHRPMRNAACTTMAPTGTIGPIAGCSSGIEPLFSIMGERRVLGKAFGHLHPLLEELGQQQGWMDDKVRAALLEGVPPHEIEAIPRGLARVLVTAHEVSPAFHVRVQAAFQKHIDNAVSKTVNLPASATVEDVARIFKQAHKLGCKGITVYRDGSRQGQVLTKGREQERIQLAPMLEPRPRARVTEGKTYKARVGCGTVFAGVNCDEEGTCEVFANVGKSGGCPAQTEATCRAVSVALRCGVNPRVLVEQLKGIRCLSTCVAKKENKDIQVLSCPDAIARAIEESLTDRPVAPPPQGRKCPICGHVMRRESGCFVCDRCLENSCG